VHPWLPRPFHDITINPSPDGDSFFSLTANMSTAPDPKKRKSFTDVERQRLRLYHYTYPGLPTPQLASWFESELGRKVSNSSVHDILSQKYAYLDSAEATYSLRKKKGPQWAELEDALFKWWQEVRPREVTGRELKLKAEEIWKSLPESRGRRRRRFQMGGCRIGGLDMVSDGL
jgi:hypothetical protein